MAARLPNGRFEYVILVADRLSVFRVSASYLIIKSQLACAWFWLAKEDE